MNRDIQTVWELSCKYKNKEDVLEQIIQFTKEPRHFRHVVSLNPEIVVQASRDTEYLTILRKADISLVDGIGLKLASGLLNLPWGDRYSGVDLMSDLLSWAHTSGVKVMLIGGKSEVAKIIADRQKKSGSSSCFFATKGIADISHIDPNKERELFSIVADMMPHIVFVAYGSPAQEKWIWANRDRFNKSVCIGVGGAFDFLSGKVSRAPLIIRKTGFEWFYRLLKEPWRWRRQVRLVEFLFLVLKRWLSQLL